MKFFTLVTMLDLTISISAKNIAKRFISDYLYGLSNLEDQINVVSSQLATFSATPDAAHATSALEASHTLVNEIEFLSFFIETLPDLADADSLELVQPLEDMRQDFAAMTDSAIDVRPRFIDLSLDSEMRDTLEEEYFAIVDMTQDLKYKTSTVMNPLIEDLGYNIEYEIYRGTASYTSH